MKEMKEEITNEQWHGRFLTVIIFVMLGFAILCGIVFYIDGYKKGQEDALRGKYKYELIETKIIKKLEE